MSVSAPYIPDILSYIFNVMLKTSSQGSHGFPQTKNKDPTRISLALKGPALHVYASFFSPTVSTKLSFTITQLYFEAVSAKY